VLKEWQEVCCYIAGGNCHEFKGSKKEAKVLSCLTSRISKNYPQICLDSNVRFGDWFIDIVCCYKSIELAIEGKFKLQSDGAVPDNRKEAFFDLHKLEKYSKHENNRGGVFLWLTDQPHYLKEATGDSKDFSSHHGRNLIAGQPLVARRFRRKNFPNPLILGQSYSLDWKPVGETNRWSTLIVEIGTGNQSKKDQIA